MAGRSWLDDDDSIALSHSQPQIHQSTERDISQKARTKCMPRRKWGEAPKWNTESFFQLKSEAVTDARRSLYSWAEAKFLWYLSAKYCPLAPSPRSTIAATFSSDGKTLASTHGDHTLKTIDCKSGSCLKVLSGHQRTPWVV